MPTPSAAASTASQTTQPLGNFASSTAYDICLGFHFPAVTGAPEYGHGLHEGQAIIYQVSPSGAGIGSLSDTGVYYVHVLDDWTIQLAGTYCDAVSHSFDASCGNLTRNPILIGRPSDNFATHAIRPAPIVGLTHGHTYQVHRVNANNITLPDVRSTTDITLATVDSSGGSINGDVKGNQALFVASSALQIATATPQQISVEPTGTLPSPTEDLLATDGTSLRV